MAVHDGAATLPDQLASIAAQTHRNWRLLARDDGSRDNSREILRAFAAEGHDARLLTGTGRGAADNFMALIRAMPDHAPADSWLAFADQDDVWLPEKLARALATLGKAGSPDQPMLYCSRTWICDADLRNRRLSAPRPRPPGFRNALVQNIASGNTILLNPAAARLVCAAAREVDTVVIHDWWIYLLVTGAGGKIVHDDRPGLLYRQHAGNLIGANDGIGARLHRLRRLLAGDMRRWTDSNIAALSRSAARLSPANRALLETFAAMRAMPLPRLLSAFRSLGLYRQTHSATFALWLAVLLGRL